MTLTKVIKKNYLLLSMVVIFLLLNNLGIISAFYAASQNDHIEYSGVPYINSGDYFVYQSRIQQGEAGHLFTLPLHNHRANKGIFFSPHWYVIGQFNKYTNIDPTVSYQIFRVLLSIILICIVWKIFRLIFSYKKSLLALALLLFSNGLGILFYAFFPNSSSTPANYHLPENLTFTALQQSPSTIFSQILLFAIVFLFVKNYKKPSINLTISFLLLFALLILVHPYDIVTVLCILSIFYLWELIRTRDKNIVWMTLVLYAVALLAGFYFYLSIRSDFAVNQVLEQNILHSGNFTEYLWGFGALFFTFAGGVWLVLKNKLYTDPLIKLMLIWGLSTWVLVYLPFLDFQRRLGNGWHLPITILSVIFLSYLLKKYKKSFLATVGFMFLFTFLLLDTFFQAATHSLVLSRTEGNKAMFESGRLETYRTIKEQTEEGDIFMTMGSDGAILPAFTGRHVYVGHLIETWQPNEKQAEVKQLWGYEKNLQPWLTRENIDYIFISKYYSPEEFESANWIVNQPYIEPIIDDGRYKFYRVTYP